MKFNVIYLYGSVWELEIVAHNVSARTVRRHLAGREAEVRCGHLRVYRLTTKYEMLTPRVSRVTTKQTRVSFRGAKHHGLL